MTARGQGSAGLWAGRPRVAELATRYGLASREAKWETYCRAFPPRRGERVLDVGVSRLDDLPGENYFLRRYPFPKQLTGVGVDDLSGLRSRYPGVRFVQADGRELQFEDKAFDVVHSNAVVEHVGSRREQERFVSELVRVAKAGFITTPNRWFPIEAHLRLPLVHWLPRPATLAVLRGLGASWHVWLLSPRSFKALFPPDVELTLFRQRMGGLTATLLVLFDSG